jgi:hypothetical protein
MFLADRIPLTSRGRHQNVSMTKRKKPGEELDRAERQRAVVALIREGLSFREIADRTGISKSTAHRRYKQVVAQLPAVQDLREHRGEVFADAEMVIDSLRDRVYDDEVRPPRHEMNVFMRCMETKMRVLGLYDPPPPPPPVTRASTNAQLVPQGKSMWSMALEHPSDD